MQENSGADSYRRYLEGDKEAFRDIIQLYRKGLIGFIYRYVGNIGQSRRQKGFFLRIIFAAV